MVQPQCRGYVHRTAFYSTLYKIIVLICALSCRSLHVLKAVHTAASLYAHSCRSSNHLQKPSAHTTAEVVHAHSWDLTFSYKIALASHHSSYPKILTSLNYKSAYLYSALLQNHGLKPWASQTLNPGLKPWFNYKKRAFSQTQHP